MIEQQTYKYPNMDIYNISRNIILQFSNSRWICIRFKSACFVFSVRIIYKRKIHTIYSYPILRKQVQPFSYEKVTANQIESDKSWAYVKKKIIFILYIIVKFKFKE